MLNYINRTGQSQEQEIEQCTSILDTHTRGMGETEHLRVKIQINYRYHITMGKVTPKRRAKTTTRHTRMTVANFLSSPRDLTNFLICQWANGIVIQHPEVGDTDT